MIQMNSQEANNVLNDLRTNEQGLLVEFIKKDGSIRKMHATLNSTLIPQDKQPKGSEEAGSEAARSAVRVFDTEVGEWRSFIWENVTVVNGELV